MKQQKLSVDSIVKACEAFDVFGSTDKPGKVGLTAILIVDKLEGTDRSYRKAHAELVTKYALTRVVPPTDGSEVPTTEFIPAKDSQGNILHGSKQVDPTKNAEFQAELKKMLEVEVEISTPTLAAEDISKLTVQPNVLKAIYPFIVWAPEK